MFVHVSILSIVLSFCILVLFFTCYWRGIFVLKHKKTRNMHIPPPPSPHACSTPPHMHVPHPLRASTPPPHMHVHHPTACISPTTPHAYPSPPSHAYQRRREGESEMRQVQCDRCHGPSWIFHSNFGSSKSCLHISIIHYPVVRRRWRWVSCQVRSTRRS